MAADNQQKVLLFGRDISEGRQDQQEGGGDDRGCSLTLMEMPATKGKEKINFHEGNCSYSAMENQTNKRKRPENDHDRKSDVSSDLMHDQQQQTGAGPSALKTNSDGQNTTQKLMLTKKLVHNPTVVVIAPRAVNFFGESSPSNRTSPPPPQQQQQQQQQQQLEEQEQANIRLATLRIGSFRHFKPFEEEEERRRGVSTRLQLYSDQWKVSKRLTMSDVSTMSRVLIHANLVDTHIKPFMVRAGIFNQVETSEGLRVYVWDVETNTFHKLVFKRWASLRSFIFVGNWGREFVRRRSLKEGDEIGFLWDPYKVIFLFRVLGRAPIPNPDP